MNREEFYKSMMGEADSDYEMYLNTAQLLTAQKDFEALCNQDELQFQIVHQVQELWMKLIAYTLLNIDEYMAAQNTNRVITLFQRVHRIQRNMLEIFSVLETMSPKDYQKIRLQLGNGSGQESPGFSTLHKIAHPLWQTFQTHYLEKRNQTLEEVYNTSYQHSDAYLVAEAMANYDELFQKFRFHHLLLIDRSIGLSAKSLKGRPVTILQNSVHQKLFPALWDIRGQMTDEWGASYGVVRDSLNKKDHEPA